MFMAPSAGRPWKNGKHKSRNEDHGMLALLLLSWSWRTSLFPRVYAQVHWYLNLYKFDSSLFMLTSTTSDPVKGTIK